MIDTVITILSPIIASVYVIAPIAVVWGVVMGIIYLVDWLEKER